MSETKGGSIANRAPLFTLSGPSHLFSFLLSPFRQRGLTLSDTRKPPRAVDISYGICVGLVAEWLHLHTRRPGDDAHTRTNFLVTAGREIAIIAQVAYLKFAGDAPGTGSKGSIGAALKKAKVGKTISAGSPKMFNNIGDTKITEMRAFLTAQVSSQYCYYIFNLYFDYGADGHAIAAFHENTLAGAALRIFEPNFGEMLVPYVDFGTFWTDLIAEYRTYRNHAGALDPKRLTSVAVHTLQ